jgi:anti-sigma28 factor (negative regulator of flagellin synthesis)
VADENGRAVSPTERAHELTRLLELARSVPEARSPKLDAVRKAVLEGTYEVSAAAVAESLMRELLGAH